MTTMQVAGGERQGI